MQHLATVKTASQDALAASPCGVKPYATLSHSRCRECASEQTTVYSAGKESGARLGRRSGRADEPTA